MTAKVPKVEDASSIDKEEFKKEKRRRNTEAVRKCREKQRAKIKSLDKLLDLALKENKVIKEKISEVIEITTAHQMILAGKRRVNLQDFETWKNTLLEADCVAEDSQIQDQVRRFREKKFYSEPVNRTVVHSAGKAFVEQSFKPSNNNESPLLEYRNPLEKIMEVPRDSIASIQKSRVSVASLQSPRESLSQIAPQRYPSGVYNTTLSPGKVNHSPPFATSVTYYNTDEVPGLSLSSAFPVSADPYAQTSDNNAWMPPTSVPFTS